MKRLTNKQMNLYNTQDIEPLFVYFNPIHKVYNFGIVRLGVPCIHITTSLRKALSRGLIMVTEEEIPLKMKSVPNTIGYKIEILKGYNPNIKDKREEFNNTIRG